MTRQQIVMKTTKPRVDRRQPLLENQDRSSGGGSRFAEVAGGTTAECAAVCCCCPCALVNILVLAVYKVPAGLCRKALRKKRRQRLIKKGMLIQQQSGSGAGTGGECMHHARSSCDGGALAAEIFVMKSMETDKDVMELEKEMWERFYGTGFWRSPSQRVD